MPGREATLSIAAQGDRPARDVKVVAKRAPRSIPLDVVLTLTQITGVLVVLGAAYLVWIRPGPMTWGFFAYILYFTPGSTFQYLAWLQQWPQALLAQNVAYCFFQAAGYTGLLLFALRVPIDETKRRWRPVVRALPAVAVVFLALELASVGSAFGFRSELAMRSAIIVGFVVSAAAIAILIARRADLPPRDYQRIRWVIAGCLIGLPAFLIAGLWQETSLGSSFFGAGAATENITDLFFDQRRAVPVRRGGGAATDGRQRLGAPAPNGRPRGVAEPGRVRRPPRARRSEQMDQRSRLGLGLADFRFGLLRLAPARMGVRPSRPAVRSGFRRAERRLEQAGREIRRAGSLDEIERLLVEEPAKTLGLASAAAFRARDGVFRRTASFGWDTVGIDTLKEGEPPLPVQSGAAPFSIEVSAGEVTLARPVFGVPVGDLRRRFAVVLYSGHVVGTDLKEAERQLLGALARDAEFAYGQVERETLQNRSSVSKACSARRQRLRPSSDELNREGSRTMSNRALKRLGRACAHAYSTPTARCSTSRAAARCAGRAGGQRAALTALWRDKQLQYTWLRAFGPLCGLLSGHGPTPSISRWKASALDAARSAPG